MYFRMLLHLAQLIHVIADNIAVFYSVNCLPRFLFHVDNLFIHVCTQFIALCYFVFFNILNCVMLQSLEDAVVNEIVLSLAGLQSWHSLSYGRFQVGDAFTWILLRMVKIFCSCSDIVIDFHNCRWSSAFNLI